MLVFVDESGDPGMKAKPGSSELFIVTAVVFSSNEEAERCDRWIAKCREDCFRGRNQEFRFNKCCDDHRRKFLAGACAFDWFYLGLVLNKSGLWGEGFAFKESFYKYTCKLLFQNAKPFLREAYVIIDKSGNREFRLELQKYLRARTNLDYETIRKVRTEPSHSNNLLQLADMVCGALARSFRFDKSDSFEFREMLKLKENYVQIWPRAIKKKTR